MNTNLAGLERYTFIDKVPEGESIGMVKNFSSIPLPIKSPSRIPLSKIRSPSIPTPKIEAPLNVKHSALPILRKSHQIIPLINVKSSDLSEKNYQELIRINIENMRAFTVKDFRSLPNNIYKEMKFEEKSDIDINNDLIEENYIIGELTFNDEKYTIIHGFPDGNPTGIIFNNIHTYLIGDITTDKSYGILQLWYMNITNNIKDFDKLIIPRPRLTQESDISLAKPSSMFINPMIANLPKLIPLSSPTNIFQTPLVAPISLVDTSPLQIINPIQIPKTKINEQITIFTPEMINENTIIDHARTFDKINFTNLLSFLADAYHNEESLISDVIYDRLNSIYEDKYGTYDIVGAEPHGDKVELPYYLGSLRKLKENKEISIWSKNYPGPYLLEDKIDGLTLLFVSEMIMNERKISLYTRGSGTKGVDVSHLLGYMKLPKINFDIVIRGEVVLTKEAFTRIGDGFKNARNMVSGAIMAKKQFNPVIARELSFFAYKILNDDNIPEDDILKLQKLGFLVPEHILVPEINKDILEKYYIERKEESLYEIDGIVIYQNKTGKYLSGENPKHVVAFKTEIVTETKITTVTRVIWQASKDKLLKPVVQYESITLSGADLKQASGYNARFIDDNNIGPGAKIIIIRSGEVIPKILEVIEPAPNGADFPDENIHGKYEWNENHVEFVLIDDNDEVITNKLKHFLTTLDVKNAGPARIRHLVDAGIKDITSLLLVTPAELSNIPGIGDSLSNQIYNDIHEKITNVSLAKIMDASGIFAKIGERRFEMILKVYPNLLDYSYNNPTEIAELIHKVKGFNLLADEIAKLLGIFADWLNKHPSIIIEQPKILITPNIQTKINNKLEGMTIVFSGFRDKTLEDRIKKKGGKVTTAV